MFNLIKSLNKFTPYDERENYDLIETLHFLNSTQNAFDRSNPSGHITAGALVCDTAGNVLLNHHKKTGMWFQFGGHSDGNPNTYEVALREVFEESGINTFLSASDSIFDVSIQDIEPNKKRNEPAHHHYDINFLFVAKDHNFKISNESTEIKWCSLDEAREPADPNDYVILRMLNKYEKLLKSAKLIKNTAKNNKIIKK